MTDLVSASWAPDHDGIMTITLDSPHNRNALGLRLLGELDRALQRTKGQERLRGVLLASSSPVFSSGADLTEVRAGGMEPLTRQLLQVMRSIVTFPLPVVARVCGPVRAGGLGILAAADIVVAANTATFAFTETRLGLAPATISTTVLPVMSPRAAALSFLTAGTFDGKAAEEWGLVTLAVDPHEIDAAVDEVLKGIVACEHQGLRASKALLNHAAIERIDVWGDRLVADAATLFKGPVARQRIEEALKPSRRRAVSSDRGES
jgi:enoyl-CoA hydratase/carnithine racemase